MAKPSYSKVLSVRQPWAWLLVHGYKDIENRNWPTKVRGRCLIHAGKTFDQEGYAWVQQNFPEINMPAEFQRGGIVGWVNIADCVTESDSPWFFGKYGFVVSQSGELPFGPMPGQLGFFTPEPPYRVIVEVEPNKLHVQSDDAPDETADVRVSVLDFDGEPVEDIPLSGETRPDGMGEVSDFENTDQDGNSRGTWFAGDREGPGVLIVSAPDAQGEAAIELLEEPDIDDDDDDDDDADDPDIGHDNSDGNDDGETDIEWVDDDDDDADDDDPDKGGGKGDGNDNGGENGTGDTDVDVDGSDFENEDDNANDGDGEPDGKGNQGGTTSGPSGEGGSRGGRRNPKLGDKTLGSGG